MLTEKAGKNMYTCIKWFSKYQLLANNLCHNSKGEGYGESWVMDERLYSDLHRSRVHEDIVQDDIL